MDEKKEKWLEFFAYAAELAINSGEISDKMVSCLLGYKAPGEAHSEFFSDYPKYFEIIFGHEPLME